MFDTYHSSVAPSYPQTVYHYRAPTDESIRLYKELEEKAIRNIVCQGKLEDCEFDVRWTLIRDVVSGDNELHWKFTINGRTERGSFRIERYKRILDDFRTELIQAVTKSVVKVAFGKCNVRFSN